MIVQFFKQLSLSKPHPPPSPLLPPPSSPPHFTPFRIPNSSSSPSFQNFQSFLLFLPPPPPLKTLPVPFTCEMSQRGGRSGDAGGGSRRSERGLAGRCCRDAAAVVAAWPRPTRTVWGAACGTCGLAGCEPQTAGLLPSASGATCPGQRNGRVMSVSVCLCVCVCVCVCVCAGGDLRCYNITQ